MKPCQTPGCDSNTYGPRARYCKPCIKERGRLSNIVSYHRHYRRFKPYEKVCNRCDKDFLIENRYQGKRIYCDGCQKVPKVRDPAEPKGVKINLKSASKRTKCRCIRCGEIHYKILFLYPDELAKVDAGRPHRKRCAPCDVKVAGMEAEGYNLGVV